MNLAHHQAALQLLCDQTCALQRVPDNATSDSDRTTIQAALRCTQPIEMKNDERERAKMSSVAAICLFWTMVPDNGQTIQERDRILLNGVDYRVRKVKAWPMVDPQYYELHIEDEQ